MNATSSVAEALRYLDALGYRPFLSSHVWSLYRRPGYVHVSRQRQDWSWVSGSGEAMSGVAGDWPIVEGTDTWSITGEAFAATYQRVDGDLYEGIGIVWARGVELQERIETSEGPITARLGDHVVRDRSGNQWIVLEEVLRRLFFGRLR